VPLRVRYGMTCLIIRDAVRTVLCSDEWKISVVTRTGSHGARGAMVPRLPRETLVMLWYCVLPWQSLAYEGPEKATRGGVNGSQSKSTTETWAISQNRPDAPFF
jgi:hypothetical protein